MFNWISLGVLSLILIIGISKIISRIQERHTDLVCRIVVAENKMIDYQKRYVQPENQFYYHWTHAAGHENDFEVLKWCMDQNTDAVKYKYHNSTGPSKSVYPASMLEVWITDPSLAMEFKLRFHGV